MIDVVVVTYNAKQTLERCLDSIRRNTSIDYALTILDNASTDGTFKYLESLQPAGVRVIRAPKNLGFSGAANLVLKTLNGEFVALLDDDIEVPAGWLEDLYSQISDKPNVGIVGGKIVYPNQRIMAAEVRMNPIRCPSANELDKGQREYIKECDTLIGPCWLMRRELITKVGDFDERFFPSQGEDYDYCIRTRLAGYKIVYHGQVKIVHHHLFRTGSANQNRTNRLAFRAKWSEVFTQFPLADSHSADQSMAKAIQLLQSKEFKGALERCEQVERLDPQLSEPIVKALALAGLGQAEEASRIFGQLLELNPSNFLAHHYLMKISNAGSNSDLSNAALSLGSDLLQRVQLQISGSNVS